MSKQCPLIIDFEASSLNSHGSYPIEIAWTKADGEIVSHLINLTSVIDDLDWSPISEEVHHISLDDVLENGVDPSVIVDEFLEDRKGRAVFSDAPVFDLMWMRQLFQMADREMPVAQILDYESLLTTVVRQKVSGGHKVSSVVSDLIEDGVESHRTHRAEGDVLALRNTYLRAVMLRPELSHSPSP